MFELTPFSRTMMNPFAEMDRMARSFFGEPSAFRTDVKDSENAYTLEAELPGFSKEDIAIDIDGNRLTIQAQRKNESDRQEGNYLRRERLYGSYRRSFDISQIDAEHIHAAYENGILKLELPKKHVSAPEARRLEIQ